MAFRVRRRWGWLLVAAAMAMAAAAVFVIDRFRGILGDRDRSRLLEIGQAISQYNQDYGGTFPASISELIRLERLNPNLADCDAGLPIFGRPSTFVYLGRNLSEATADGHAVVAYAPLSDNAGVATDVLFGDGHTDWVTAADLPAVLARGGPATRPTIRSTTAPGGVQSGHG